MKTLRSVLLIFAVTSLIASCGKDASTPVIPQTIIGTWKNVTHFSDGPFIYMMTFKSDSTYISESGPNYTINGTFQDKNGSIIFTHIKRVSGTNIKYYTAKDTVMWGRYTIKDNVLTSTYWSYPNDYPVTTVKQYNRVP